MNKTLGTTGILVVVLISCIACAPPVTAAAHGELITPPAISVPYGGKIVTEINLSDNDMLGIIKEAIPTLGRMIAEIAPMAASGQMGAKTMAAIRGSINSIDFAALADAISGITNVRVLIIKYRIDLKQAELQAQLDSGVAKLGTFSKVVSDVGMIPGVTALYAQAENGGYIGYSYDARSRTLYAGRMVGSVDTGKLMKLLMGAVTLGIEHRQTMPAPDSKPTPPDAAPEPETR